MIGCRTDTSEGDEDLLPIGVGRTETMLTALDARKMIVRGVKCGFRAASRFRRLERCISVFGLLGRILWHQRWVLLWLVLLVLLAGGWAYWRRDVLASYLESRRQRNQVADEVRALEEEKKLLEHERDTLKEGGFASEKVARETYHMSKPGEKILRLAPTAHNDETPASTTLRRR
jgi:cell division protein FtsB